MVAPRPEQFAATRASGEFLLGLKSVERNLALNFSFINSLQHNVACDAPGERLGVRQDSIQLFKLLQLLFKNLTFYKHKSFIFKALPAGQKDSSFSLGTIQEFLGRLTLNVLRIPAKYPEPRAELTQHGVCKEAGF